MAQIDGLQMVRKVFPDVTDDEAGYILWNATGWPVFYCGDDPEAYFTKQLQEFKTRIEREGKESK